MDKQDSMSLSRLLFDLGSRLGSLEGYLYSEERVEEKYLHGWLQNIDREFRSLPSDERNEIATDYLELLKKVQALLRRLYGEENGNTLQVKEMMVDLKGGNP
ncbi:MAG: hypothetical protein ACREQA_05145 [Candidatus Binatia bacterium]